MMPTIAMSAGTSSLPNTFLAVLPETIVVHRITGDGAKRDLIAPLWSGDKKKVLNYLNNVLK